MIFSLAQADAGGGMAMRLRTEKTFVSMLASFGFPLLAAISVSAQTPSPALLVLEKSDDTLAIVDPAALKVIGRVPAGKDPHEVAASVDGKLAYISNYGGTQSVLKTISVVDLAAQKALTPINLGALRGAHGIEFAVGRVWFTAETNKVIARYDPATQQVEWVMGTGQSRTHMLVVTKDLRSIFTSNVSSDTVSAIERTQDGKDWKVTTVPVGKGPEGIDLSPDEKEVWAANSGDGSVSIVDVSAKKVTQAIDVKTKHSNRLRFTPDGKLVLISDPAGGELVVVDAASRKERKRINIGRNPQGIVVVPDGSRAYVALSGDNQIAVLDLRTLEVIGHIATGNSPDGMAWVQRK
jgi:YVTN family beta-propeller protein